MALSIVLCAKLATRGGCFKRECRMFRSKFRNTNAVVAVVVFDDGGDGVCGVFVRQFAAARARFRSRTSWTTDHVEVTGT